MRARLLRRFLWLAGFGCLWLHAFDDPPLRSEPFLQNVTSDAGSVVLITAEPARVEVSLCDAAGVEVGKLIGPPARRHHELRFRGLRAATGYEYHVRVDGADVGGGHLTTAPADDRAKVRFAFFGDSGEQPWWVWLQTAPILHVPGRLGWFADATAVTAIGRAVARDQPDFVLHLGDIVYPKGLNAHYRTGFFRPFADVMRDAPLYATLGNHDLMDANGVQALGNLRLPKGELTGDSRCYSFAWGAVRVIAVDCNTESGEIAPGHPAFDFLSHELAARSEPWLVVASHYPMRSGSRQGNRGDLLRLVPMLAEWGATLYVSGHDHCYQRFAKEGEVPLIVSGGGGKDLYDVHRIANTVVCQSQHHWCAAEAAGSTFRVRAYGIDGGQIDQLEVHAPTGEALERLRQKNPERARRIAALGG